MPGHHVQKFPASQEQVRSQMPVVIVSITEDLLLHRGEDVQMPQTQLALKLCRACPM